MILFLRYHLLDLCDPWWKRHDWSTWASTTNSVPNVRYRLCNRCMRSDVK